MKCSERVLFRLAMEAFLSQGRNAPVCHKGRTLRIKVVMTFLPGSKFECSLHKGILSFSGWILFDSKLPVGPNVMLQCSVVESIGGSDMTSLDETC